MYNKKKSIRKLVNTYIILDIANKFITKQKTPHKWF